MAAAAINTAVMPGDKMNPETIEAAARGIRGVGTAVSGHGSTVLTAWQKISGVYEAPEQQTLFTAMNPVKTEAEAFGTDLGTTATALETFAAEVRIIKAAVAQIRKDAAAFLKTIEGGTVSVTYYGGGDYYTDDFAWDTQQEYVDKNNDLIRRTNDQQEALWAAERTCANAINDITGQKHIEAASEANCQQGYGVDEIPDNAPMEWGAAVERQEDCLERAGDGVWDAGVGMFNGIVGLAGFEWDQETGWDHDWGRAGASWTGLGQVATGLVVLGNPAMWPSLAQPGPVGDWYRASVKTTTQAVAGLVAIDPYAKDPLQQWKDDPAHAFGQTLFNVVTLGVAELKVGNAARAGSFGARAAELARLTDPIYLAQRAAAAAKSGLGATMEAIARMGRAADLDTTIRISTPDVTIDAPTVPRTDVGTDTPNVGPHVDAPESSPHATDAPPPRDVTPDQSPSTHPGTHPDTTPDANPSPTTPHSTTPDGTTPDGGPQAGHPDQPGTPGGTPDQPGTPGGTPDQPGTPGQPGGTPDPVRPGDTTPVNDANLPKTDAQVRTDVDQIRRDIAPDLQRQADQAWQDAAARAQREGLPATPQRLGSYAHKELADWITAHADELVDTRSGYQIRVEASFEMTPQGVQPAAGGTAGSIRPDIVLERVNRSGQWEVVHVIDYKTGKAGISTSWERKVQNWLQPLYGSETLRPNVTVPTNAAPVGP